MENLGKFLLQLLDHLIELPQLPVSVLQPFKITAYHSAGVTKDIRNNSDSLAKQDFFSFRICWAVSTFSNYRSLDLIGILAGDLVSKCCRDQNVTFQSKEIF